MLESDGLCVFVIRKRERERERGETCVCLFVTSRCEPCLLHVLSFSFISEARMFEFNRKAESCFFENC